MGKGQPRAGTVVVSVRMPGQLYADLQNSLTPVHHVEDLLLRIARNYVTGLKNGKS
jgi:hypothetical protein